MSQLDSLAGDAPTRVYISTLNGEILRAITNEKDTLRTPCRRGYAMKIDGEWREVTKAGKLK